MPSSTINAVRPASDTRWRVAAESSGTARELRLLPRLGLVDLGRESHPQPARRRSFRMRTPPSPIAPIASSGWKGTPSLRTTMTSSGTASARATSNATGTPPRGSPSTTRSVAWEIPQSVRQPATGVDPIDEQHDDSLPVRDRFTVRRRGRASKGRMAQLHRVSAKPLNLPLYYEE